MSNNKETVKKIIYCVFITLAVLSVYFGSFLALKKAQAYPKALASVTTITTIDQFKKVFQPALDLPSPVGQEEVVRFISTLVINALPSSQNTESAEKGNRQVIEFLEPYMFKNNVRHLMILGGLYSEMWDKHGNKEDYLNAEKYYKIGLQIGPKLPPMLYGLFTLYKSGGDKDNMKKIGEKILSYWPDDTGVRDTIK